MSGPWSASSARRHSATFCSSGTSTGSWSPGVRYSPTCGVQRLQLDLAHCRSRARTGEGNRSHGRVPGAAFVEPPIACESPGAVDEHADADPSSLGVVDRVDATVARRDVLGPALDGAGVGIAGTRADRSIYSPGAERLHRARLSIAIRPAASLPVVTSSLYGAYWSEYSPGSS